MRRIRCNGPEMQILYQNLLFMICENGEMAKWRMHLLRNTVCFTPKSQLDNGSMIPGYGSLACSGPGFSVLMMVWIGHSSLVPSPLLWYQRVRCEYMYHFILAVPVGECALYACWYYTQSRWGGLKFKLIKSSGILAGSRYAAARPGCTT